MSPGQTVSLKPQLVNGAHHNAHLVLAHDFLIQVGGAERVFASLHKMWPGAPIYTSATDYACLLPDFKDAEIHNSWMQMLPRLRAYHKAVFPLYPLAFKSFGRIEGDAAVVSSSSFSKWLRFTPRTRVFCYCHSPPRYFWQTEDYLKNELQNRLLKALARLFMTWLRRSDVACAKKVHHFIANSNNVRTRIREIYDRDSVVIYPPVEVNRYHVTPHHEGYYLAVSRLVSYKCIDRAVVAFVKNGKRLVIAGGGPDRARLEQLSGGAANIEFRGRVEDAEAVKLIENCRALILPGSEDFGIAPVEAQSAGKPVLAFGDRGALETVVDGETGVLFTDPSPEGINASVGRLEAISWDPDRIRRHAERFAEPNFIAAMQNYVREQLAVPAPQLP
jgi:glycosyltransferase involved in cell wall biosynthesis